MTKSYNFEKVTGTESQIGRLYELLNKRVHVISHDRLPNYENHRVFVKNHPYLHWYLVREGNIDLGSLYIKSDNSIGMNLTVSSKKVLEECVMFIKDNFNPQPAKASLVPDFFYINCSFSNKKTVETLQELGLSPLQMSLRLN